MIIDSHAHLLRPESAHQELMTAAGVDKTILFVTSPHPETAPDFPALVREFSQLRRTLAGERTQQEQRERLLPLNREVAAAVGRDQDRFLGFGMVPPGMAEEETGRWIQTEIVGNGLRGLGEFALPSGKMNELRPVFAAAAQLGNLPLWVHTFHPCGLEDIADLFALARQYPSVPLIAGHAGGPHWLQVMEWAQEIPNVYLDLSAVFTVFIPQFAMRVMPERTLFSSDAPYGNPRLCRDLIEACSPDPAVTRLVLGENIAGLLGL